MGARFHSGWQKIIEHPFITTGIIVVSALLIALIVVEIRLYGTGFAGKTLFDWLNLLGVLAIPAVVGLGAAWYTSQQAKESDANRERRHETDIEIAKKNRKREQQTALQIAEDNRQEAALNAYIDKIAELIRSKVLNRKEERKVARAQTLLMLAKLDGVRKRSVLQFLQVFDLIDRNSDTFFIDIHAADLSRAALRNANMSHPEI